MNFEFEIITRGLSRQVLIFKRYSDGRLRFWEHARSVEKAIASCASVPVTVIARPH